MNEDEELPPPETVFVVPIDLRIEVEIPASSARVAEAFVRAELDLERGPVLGVPGPVAWSLARVGSARPR